MESSKVQFKDKEHALEEEIRMLRRKVDEAQFETEKARKEGEFKFTLSKASQDAEFKRLLSDLALANENLRSLQEEFSRFRSQSESKFGGRENEFLVLRETFEQTKNTHTQHSQSQKAEFERMVSAMEASHANDIKGFQEKFLAITSSNEKLLAQLSSYATMERELIELRRTLKSTKSLSSGVDHLWEVK